MGHNRVCLGWENTRVGACFLRSWEGRSHRGPKKHLLPLEMEQGGGCLGMGWLKYRVRCPEQGNRLCTGS